MNGESGWLADKFGHEHCKCFELFESKDAPRSDESMGKSLNSRPSDCQVKCCPVNDQLIDSRSLNN